jgi:hypothetical protein
LHDKWIDFVEWKTSSMYTRIATRNTLAWSMAVPRKTRPQLPQYPVYVDSIAQTWRREHPKEDGVLTEWETAGCNIKSLAELVSLWIIGFSTRQETKRVQRELVRLSRKVENSCSEFATFLESTYVQQLGNDELRAAAKRDVEHYQAEARRAALHRSQWDRRDRDSPFTVDRFGRPADLRPLVAVQEEVRRHTGKRPGDAQLGILLKFAEHACELAPCTYPLESLRKSLYHFRTNPRVDKWFRDLADTPLQDIVNRFSQESPETNSPKN